MHHPSWGRVCSDRAKPRHRRAHARGCQTPDARWQDVCARGGCGRGRATNATISTDPACGAWRLAWRSHIASHGNPTVVAPRQADQTRRPNAPTKRADQTRRTRRTLACHGTGRYPRAHVQHAQDSKHGTHPTICARPKRPRSGKARTRTACPFCLSASTVASGNQLSMLTSTSSAAPRSSFADSMHRRGNSMAWRRHDVAAETQHGWGAGGEAHPCPF